MGLINLAQRFISQSTRERVNELLLPQFNRMGYARRLDMGPVDLRGLNINVVDALRRAAGLPVLLDIPLRDVRNMSSAEAVAYFSCGGGEANPFIATIKQCLDNPNLKYSESALRSYHDSFQPSTIAEVLGLENSGSLHPILLQPPLLAFPPWSQPPLRRYKAHLKARQQNVTTDNRSHGANISFRLGVSGFGPVGREKGEFEVQRLKKVTDSIAASGYNVLKGMRGIRVITLQSNGEYRFICAHGQHRTAALTALGYETTPAIPYPNIINRDDVLQWPGVTSSVFTPTQALRVFDMMFDGQPPATALAWCGAR